MKITYEVNCFNRTLEAIFPDKYENDKDAILQMIDEYYDLWHNPSDIEDPDVREEAECGCCEEFIMDQVAKQYDWEDWDSIGDDEDEEDNEMSNQVFTMAEAENLFEIGRSIQYLVDEGAIEIGDSQDAFWFAMRLAVNFEKEHPETDDYYGDLDEYMRDKILEEFGGDE